MSISPAHTNSMNTITGSRRKVSNDFRAGQVYLTREAHEVVYFNTSLGLGPRDDARGPHSPRSKWDRRGHHVESREENSRLGAPEIGSA